MGSVSTGEHVLQEARIFKARAIRTIAKVGLFALVIAIAGLAVALDGRPASASHTKIIASLSAPDPQNPGQTTCPSPPVAVTTIVAIESGGPMTLCVWAKDVDDPEGVGAFELGFTYNSTVVTVLSVNPQRVWLGSTGRSAFCSGITIDPNPETGAGVASTGCGTINVPPPYGPQGTGLIGKVMVQPGAVHGLTTLNFAAESFLVDTGRVSGTTVIDPARIPNSVISVNFRTSACADYNGDGTVRIPDILKIVQKYGTNDPVYDLDRNGIVLVPDIIIGVLQYGQTCPIS